MVRRRRTERVISHARFNMTPMIDIVFLLIVFFMLVSSFASVEMADVALPDPDVSQAREIKLLDKVVLNLQHVVGLDEPTITLGPFVIATPDELRERLVLTKKANPRVQVILRADREVHYRYVREAMDAVAAAGIERMNIGAQTDR